MKCNLGVNLQLVNYKDLDSGWLRCDAFVAY